MTNGRSPRSQALHLGGLLFRAHLVARQAANDAMRDQDVELRDLGILELLAGGASETQQQIGARLGIDKSAVVRMVDGLEGKGLVTRRRRTDDRRAYEISITGRGRSRMRAAWARAEGAMEELLAGFSTAERETLRDLLERLVDPA